MFNNSFILFLGIPWLAEFISQIITHMNGPEESFEKRILIDLLNLFTVWYKDYNVLFTV